MVPALACVAYPRRVASSHLAREAGKSSANPCWLLCIDKNEGKGFVGVGGDWVILRSSVSHRRNTREEEKWKKSKVFVSRLVHGRLEAFRVSCRRGVATIFDFSPNKGREQPTIVLTWDAIFHHNSPTVTFSPRPYGHLCESLHKTLCLLQLYDCVFLIFVLTFEPGLVGGCLSSLESIFLVTKKPFNPR